jgi:peptidyl-prolyl cis-trans isomerase C
MRCCVLLCLPSLVLCCQPARPLAAAVPTHALATMDGTVLVTVEDLEAELRQSPSSPLRQTSQSHAKEVLDRLIQFELLSREAEKAALEKDDEVQRQKKKAMVNRLVERKLNQDARAHASSETDLRVYYEAHLNEYVRPERFRVRMIEVDWLADGGVAPSEALKTLVARGVGDATPAEAGDARWMTSDELAQAYGPGVARAVSDLKVNQISDPVRGLRGWCIVRLSGRQEAINKSFERARPILQGRADSEKRAALADRYAEELDRRSSWQVDEAALAGVDPMLLPSEPPRPVAPK